MPSDRKDPRWWRQDFGRPRHEAVWEQVRALETTHADRLTSLRAWYSLYRDEPSDNLTLMAINRDGRMRDNVIQNAVDAAHAKITKNRPKPWIVTLGAKWSLRNKAKLLNQYTEGEFDRLKVYERSSEACKDAEIFGDGVLKVMRKNDRPAIEKVWSGELLVDPREARYNCVRTLYQVKAVDREVLTEMFPEFETEIARAGRIDSFLDDAEEVTSDLIHVVEAWHLPSGPVDLKDTDKKGRVKTDGRHAICVDSVTLLDEPWTKDRFPFARLPWCPDPLGYWSLGLAERMAGSQSEINNMNALISDCFDAMVPSAWVADQAQVNREIIDNVPWRVYRYSAMANPPAFQAPDPVNPQHLMRLDSLKRESYGNQGISELSARSEKPAGLNSGRGLRIHHDIESERFAAMGRQWEQFHMDIARLILDVSDEIAEDKEAAKKLEVHVGKQMLEAIRYSDAQIKDAPYEIRTFPVSALSTTPAGRLQDIEDLWNLGVITGPNDMRDLLDWPDLDRYNAVESAGRRLVDKMIEEALKGRQGLAANPYMPLEYANKQAVLQRALAELEGAPESSIYALDLLIGSIQTLMQPPAPEPMPAPPGPPGAAMPESVQPPMPGPMPGGPPIPMPMPPMAAGM